MARTIGKVNLRKLKAVVAEEITRGGDRAQIAERIIDRLPVEWWSLWEGADQEIRLTVDDELYAQ